MKKKLVLVFLIFILSTSLVFASEDLFDEYGIKNDTKLTERSLMSVEWETFEKETNIELNKEWTVRFSDEISFEDIDGAVIEKDNEFIPVNISINSDNLVIKPKDGYSNNSLYTLKLFLNNGKRYKKEFETVNEVYSYFGKDILSMNYYETDSECELRVYNHEEEHELYDGSANWADYATDNVNRTYDNFIGYFIKNYYYGTADATDHYISIDYPTLDKFKEFRFGIGLAKASQDHIGDMQFSVLGDGEVLFQETLSNGDFPKSDNSVDIEGIDKLTLKVKMTDAEKNWYFGYFLDPLLVK